MLNPQHISQQSLSVSTSPITTQPYFSHAPFLPLLKSQPPSSLNEEEEKKTEEKHKWHSPTYLLSSDFTEIFFLFSNSRLCAHALNETPVLTQASCQPSPLLHGVLEAHLPLLYSFLLLRLQTSSAFLFQKTIHIALLSLTIPLPLLSELTAQNLSISVSSHSSPPGAICTLTPALELLRQSAGGGCRPVPSNTAIPVSPGI